MSSIEYGDHKIKMSNDTLEITHPRIDAHDGYGSLRATFNGSARDKFELEVCMLGDAYRHGMEWFGDSIELTPDEVREAVLIMTVWLEQP